MKQKNITIKLFLGTLTCFLLSYLCAVAGGLTHDKDGYPIGLTKKYANLTTPEKTYAEIKRTFPVKNIMEIDVKTVSKDIQFNIIDEDQIKVTFKGNVLKNTFEPEKDFQTTVKDGVLNIKFDEHKNTLSTMNFTINYDDEGSIIIDMPKSLRKLILHTTSGNITITKADLDSIDVESVSGNIELENTNITQANISTVSGDVKSDGKLQTVIGETVSGDIKLDIENESPKIDFKTTSGDTEIAFKKIPNASFSFSSVSGSVKVDESFGGLNSESKKSKFILGKGVGTVTVNSVSGDLAIAKR